MSRFHIPRAFYLLMLTSLGNQSWRQLWSMGNQVAVLAVEVGGG
jgi:hypothetical protein